MKIEKAVITLTEDSSQVHSVLYYENGRQEEMYVEVYKFVEALANSYEPQLSPLGAIPNGYIDAAVGNNANTYRICLSVPAGIRCLSYYDDDYFIPFPECVFFLSYKNGIKEGDSYVFARIGSSDILYRYPFANVYDTGVICWGSTVLPEVTCMKDAINHIELFFGSKTNNDLYRAGSSVVFKEEFINQRGLFEFLKTKQFFPEELLVPTERSLSGTVRNWTENGTL